MMGVAMSAAVQIDCPRCGKWVTLRPAEGGSVGYVATCRNCGNAFMVTPAMMAAAEQQAAAAAPVPYVEQVEEVKLNHSRRTALGVLIAVGVMLLVGGALFLATRATNARSAARLQAGRDRVTALKTQANALEGAGRLEEARQKYVELGEAVNELAPQDPGIGEVAGDVAAGERRVAQRLAQQKQQGGSSGFVTTDGAPASQPDAAAASQPTTRAVAVAPPQTPTTRPVTAPAQPLPDLVPVSPVARNVDLTDEQIGDSIRRGVEYLLGRFNTTTTFRLKNTSMLGGEPAYYTGMNALGVYALMQSAAAIRDERLAINGPILPGLIDALKEMPADRDKATYARSLRIAALAVYMRPQDRDALRDDLQYLLTTNNKGAFTYEGRRNERGALGPPQDNDWDNSNSQYGLLGVWAAAESGFAVPASFWKDVVQHWAACQLPNGGWAYRPGETSGRLSMYAAGTASLFVAHDYLDTARIGAVVSSDATSPSLRRALAWWDRGEGVTDVDNAGDHWAYTLYGIERVGLASGYKYFGRHDWYRELAKETIQRQKPDGSWGDEVNTSFVLLFLSRGRHPVLINKLRFPGEWAGRPRDAANLMRYASKRLERQLNWQAVDLRAPWYEWLDAPILYVASALPVPLLDDQVDKLRRYVEAGGLLFTQADADSSAFNAFAADLAKKLFPQYEFADLPPDHPAYNLVYKVKDGQSPPLKAVSNGARLLMVHSPKDLARAWHNREEKAQEVAFGVGVNLMVYAAGKRDFRNRLESPYIEPPDAEPAETTRVARVQYAGNWDPEPGAWRRFGTWYFYATGRGVRPEPVELSALGDLSPKDVPLAHLTGTGALQLSESDAAALRKYVEAGGVLLVDATGGKNAFASSAKAALSAAFPGKSWAPLDRRHPLLSPAFPGMDDLAKPKLRPYLIETAGAKAGDGSLLSLSAGKGHVIYTPLDLTSGLLGTRTWSIAGYDPADAPPLLKNVVLWTLNGQKDSAAR